MTSEPTNIRILHVITGLSTGGAEMMLLKLLSATHGRSCQAVVSLKNEGTIGPQIKELGVPVYALGLHPSLPNPFRALSIRSVVEKFQPDIIQGWMYHGNLMASFASMVSRRRPPVLWGVHQSVREVGDFGRLTAIAIRLGALSSRNPAKIIYVSQTGARQHEALGFRPERRVVMPNGIDCESFHRDEDMRQQVRAELGITPENVLVGLIARYHPMKDHAGFLTAAARLARTHPSARFLLVGNGVTPEQPAIESLIQKYQLEHCVFLLGERHDTTRLTAALDIACSASAWGEAFSVVIGEAMASSVPCVVTDVGDNAYLVGDTGISVPPSNPEALAGAIGRLVDAGQEHRRQLGSAARQRIETEFSLPAVAGRYEDLYREVAPHKANVAVIPAEAPATSQGQKPAPGIVSFPVAGHAERPHSAVRVLHVITDLDIGGAQMMLFKLLSATHGRLCQAVLSLKDEGTIGARIRELGVPVFSLGLRSVAPNPLRVFSVRALVKEFRPDAIQGWMYHGNLLASLAGTLSGNGIPIVWNVRQSLENIAVYRWKTANIIRLGALFSKYPTAIIYNSRSGAKHHQGFGFRNARQVVIPNGFDCEIFRPDEHTRNRVRNELGATNNTVLVGLVARYDPVKHHRGFLRAAGLLAREYKNVKFVLVGKGVTGTEPELMEAIAKEDLQERVLLLGERQDLERVTCALDIACSASWSEGFSNAIGEAMACGIPCVVTDVGDSAFLVGETGVAIPSRSEEAMTQAMALAIGKLIDAGVDHRRQLGLAARQRVEGEFSLSTIACRYEELYQELAP